MVIVPSLVVTLTFDDSAELGLFCVRSRPTNLTNGEHIPPRLSHAGTTEDLFTNERAQTNWGNLPCRNVILAATLFDACDLVAAL